MKRRFPRPTAACSAALALVLAACGGPKDAPKAAAPAFTVALLTPGPISDAGWNAAERAALQAKIAARQPFLDFLFSRVDADGSRRAYRVSGEPMFNNACGFIGYRGIGVELPADGPNARN